MRMFTITLTMLMPISSTRVTIITNYNARRQIIILLLIQVKRASHRRVRQLTTHGISRLLSRLFITSSTIHSRPMGSSTTTIPNDNHLLRRTSNLERLAIQLTVSMSIQGHHLSHVLHTKNSKVTSRRSINITTSYVKIVIMFQDVRIIKRLLHGKHSE